MMSIRTLIVGALAALCGICATAAVLLLNSGPKSEVVKNSIVVAQVEIPFGAKIESNMLTTTDWHADKLPAGSFSEPSEVIGQYTVSTVFSGETVVAAQLHSQPTTLLPEPGKFAVTIEAKSESSIVGHNLVAGNRVDVIWTMTKNHEILGGPLSKRLLENIRVLAVGQNHDPNDETKFDSMQIQDLKSVTLEVVGNMDQNLFLAQELGKLSLAMRNPNDDKEIEPGEVTNIEDLLTEAKLKQAVEESKPMQAINKLQSMVQSMVGKVDALNTQVKSMEDDKKEKVNTGLTAEALKKIEPGMRAVTIQTPEESTGVAGLLQPGHRVDVILTVDNQIYDQFLPEAKGAQDSRSVVLLQNVEVLAVDTKLEVYDDNADKKMSRSVTLIVTVEMGKDVSHAQQVGTLTLALRGHDESDSKVPRIVVDLDQFLKQKMVATPPEIKVSVPVKKEAEIKVQTVRFNRGGFNKDINFYAQEKSRQEK